MPDDVQEGMAAFVGPGRPGDSVSLARQLEEVDRLRQAATSYDRVFAVDPGNEAIRGRRSSLLDRLAVVEHGIVFRYIPAGTFLMGSESGDPDEAPVHVVRLGAYWLSETPVSWAVYCDLMGWVPPPFGRPDGFGEYFQDHSSKDRFALLEANKLRLQYDEDGTARARDWHSHIPEADPVSGEWIARSHATFGTPQRDDSSRPWTYDQKPMVSVSWHDAEELCSRITTGSIAYRLPTEAEWEKAARGGLIGARYPWGDEPPDETRCDFDRFDRFAIRPMRHFPPNGYGLYAMSGGVWEWTSDWYDAEYYRESPREDPRGPAEGTARVLRGGSWADCAEAVTVSFRMAREGSSWRTGSWGRHLAPNIGFRICRVETTGP
jgi:formylglycine-generating enzyme required for sulfatase activity